jgi:hypothetical protein
VGGPLTFDGWLDGLKAGRTFATTGPMLEFTVDEALPGTTLERREGDRVRVVALAHGHATDVPLRDLELIVHGEVVRAVSASDAGQSAESLRLTHDLQIGAGGVWIAVRARGGPTQVAHTTPVYVRANGRGFENPRTTPRYLAESEQYLTEIEAELASPGAAVNHQMWRSRAEVERRVAETRAILAQLADRP